MRITLPLLFFVVGIIGSESWAAQPPSSRWKNSSDWSQPSDDSSNGADEVSTSRKQARREKRRNISPFSPGSHNLSLDLGQVFLLGDMGDNYSNAIGVKIHYTYQVSDMFGFDSAFGYSSHSSGSFGLASGQTGLRTNLLFFDRVVPYVVVGMGFYRPSFDIPTERGVENIAPIVFGLHVGPGIHLEISKRIFFGTSVQFQTLFNAKRTLSNNRPVEVGGAFASFYLNAGVAL